LRLQVDITYILLSTSLLAPAVGTDTELGHTQLACCTRLACRDWCGASIPARFSWTGQALRWQLNSSRGVGRQRASRYLALSRLLYCIQIFSPQPHRAHHLFIVIVDRVVGCGCCCSLNWHFFPLVLSTISLGIRTPPRAGFPPGSCCSLAITFC
jgi:hypothetical protein